MNGSKWTVTTFHTTPHMPTYLAAFVICDYEHIGRIERGKEVSEGDSPGAGTFVLAADCSSTPSPRGLGLHPSRTSPGSSPKPCHCSELNAAERSAALPAGAEGFLWKGCAARPLFPGPRCLSEHREKRARGHTSILKLRLRVVYLAYLLLMPAEAAALAEMLQAG